MVQEDERRDAERVGVGKLHPLGRTRFEGKSREQDNDRHGSSHLFLKAGPDTALIFGLVAPERPHTYTNVFQQCFDRVLEQYGLERVLACVRQKDLW